jgi:hypothetical protein
MDRDDTRLKDVFCGKADDELRGFSSVIVDSTLGSFGFSDSPNCSYSCLMYSSDHGTEFGS